jgi:hypothetical protein
MNRCLSSWFLVVLEKANSSTGKFSTGKGVLQPLSQPQWSRYRLFTSTPYAACSPYFWPIQKAKITTAGWWRKSTRLIFYFTTHSSLRSNLLSNLRCSDAVAAALSFPMFFSGNLPGATGAASAIELPGLQQTDDIISGLFWTFDFLAS